MNGINIPIGVVFLSILIAVGVIYVKSKGRYTDYVESLNEAEYRLKNYLHIGFYILDKINYRYKTRYDRKLLIKLSEISGSKYGSFYLRVHMANKITFMILMLLLTCFFGIFIGPDLVFICFSVGFLGLIFYITDNEVEKKVQERRISIKIDFPEVLNKLTLLINAGMTISRAWEKVVVDSKKKSPLYYEISIVMRDIKSGKPEREAYEEFAKRCRMPEVTKFVALLLQNIRRGGQELVSLMRVLSAECWEERKSIARRLGEEASTKMILPMTIMFLAVLLIVVTPAILALM